jgi:polyisoprenoid-binding protein YceI
MSRNIRILAIVAVIIVIVGAGAFLYLTRPPEAASEDVQVNTEQLDPSDGGAAEVFRISQDDSQASFAIDEVLNGADNLVVGTTSEVAGDIKVDLNNPAASEVGQIRINARTLQTDSSRRDGAISRMILNSGQADNEFIEFQPTALNGLPDSASSGDTVEFQIVGDLTVSGTTQEVTFDASVTLTSADQITGSAEATVNYADFSLSIPSVPQVASVEDTVILSIEFVANRVAE